MTTARSVGAGSAPTQSTVVRSLAKRVAFAIDDVASHDVGTVILAYHRVGGHTVSPVDLDRRSFRRQMAHVRAVRRAISLDTFADQVASANPVEGRPQTPEVFAQDVVLTFDDGTADFVDEVMPVLVEYQLPATLYVATMNVDTGQSFPGGANPISWNGLRDAVATGLVTIGAHTHTHRLLDRCSLEEIRGELDRSNGRIEEELGSRPAHFAYPKAVPASGRLDVEVMARYKTAAVAGTRPNVAGKTNLHRLRRSPIQVADGWEGFRRKLHGGMRAEDDLRRWINKYRYRALRS